MSLDSESKNGQPTDSAGTKELLKHKLDDLRTRRGKRSLFFRMYVLGGGILIGLSPFVYVLGFSQD